MEPWRPVKRDSNSSLGAEVLLFVEDKYLGQSGPDPTDCSAKSRSAGETKSRLRVAFSLVGGK